MQEHNLRILAIETSCDETAAAVYTTDGGIRSSVLFSQIELHKQFGGVVPEIASRSHLEKIAIIVKQALEKANIDLDAIDAIAVTNKPGLPGSLLVGTCFAKALAWAGGKRIIGVNHLEGHVYSSFLEHTVPFDHLCLTVSGGHTALYLVQGFGKFQLLGQTIDDAAGEAFDKIAKLLGLAYPGGPLLEKLAQAVEFHDFYRYTRSQVPGLDFSFSGLKTAILYDLVKRGMYDLKTKQVLKPDDVRLQQEVASSLHACMADIFKQKLEVALAQHPHVRAVTFVGGVACNTYLRTSLSDFCEARGLTLYSPSRQYCTDNAAMIAFVGHYKAQQGLYDNFTLDILV